MLYPISLSCRQNIHTMALNIYLNFNGTTEEAMNFYKDATGGEIHNIMRMGDAPGMPVADEDKGKVMHGIMSIHGSTVMFSDGNAQHKVNMGDNFSMSLDYKNDADMEREFNALSAGGKVTMPLQDTFWGARFGMCTDKFGVNWMFNHDKPKA